MKGATSARSGVASALFGKVRRRVLAILFSHSHQAFHLRQIARSVGAGQGAVQRELERLVGASLIVRTRNGNRVLYQANRDSPVYPEIRGLIVKTVGIVDLLREALTPLARRIAVAFIYGSMAEGTEGADSDVDLMVIGDVIFGELSDALPPAEDALGREVNPMLIPPAELRRRLAENAPFIRAVLAGTKLFLIGDEDELRRMAGEGLAG